MKRISIRERYVSMPATVKAMFWFTACNILQKGIQFVTVPVYTRLMSVSEYGTYNVFLSWHNFLIIFATLNMSGGCANVVMTKFSDRREEAISSLQTLNIICTSLLFMIYLLTRCIWGDYLEMGLPMVTILFLEYMLAPAFYFWSVRERFEYRYKNMVGVTLLMSLATPILGVVAILSFEDKSAAAMSSKCLVASIIGLCLLVLNYKKGKVAVDWEIWKFSLLFSLPLVPHYLAGNILNQSDRLMINAICGKSEAGIYSVAFTAGMALTIINSAVNQAFTPWEYEKIKQGRIKDIPAAATALLEILALGYALFIFSAPEILKVFVTEEYHEAIYLIVPIALGCYFFYFFGYFASVEYYYEQSMYTMTGTLMASVINIILNYIGIHLWGFQAAAYTTFFSYIFLSVFHYICMKHICKIKQIEEDFYDLQSFIRISVALCFTGFIVLAIYDWTFVRYLLVAAISINLIMNKDQLIKKVTCLK